MVINFFLLNLVSHHLTKSVKEVNKKNGREKERKCVYEAIQGKASKIEKWLTE